MHLRTKAVTAAAVAAALTMIPLSAAHAAPGDTSRASGQYLSGSLLDLDAALAGSLGGEVAQSTGTATDTQGPNDLNIGGLGVVNLELPGGIQVPIDLGDVGTVAQYAQARANGSSTGASGLITGTGAIGVIGEDDAPGPLTVGLGDVVASLAPSLGAAVTNQLADLELTVGAAGATVTQPSRSAATGDYMLDDASLSFRSPAVAGLRGSVNTHVATIPSELESLLETALLAGINLPGVLAANVDVDGVSLTALVAPLLTGPITDPAHPGVTLDLSTGTVVVDLDEIVTVNGRDSGADILGAAERALIADRVVGVVTSLLGEVQDALTEATDALVIEASVTLGFSPIVEVTSTAGALLAGDASGIELVGLGLTIPGGEDAVRSMLAMPLNTVSTAIAGLPAVVLTPIAQDLRPAIDSVLGAALDLTVNGQSTVGGVFTQTALSVTLLGDYDLDIANASVGPNALAVNELTVTDVTPASGPTTGGTEVVISGTGFNFASSVTFAGVSAEYTIESDKELIVRTPAHPAGLVDVSVTSFGTVVTMPQAFEYLANPAAAPTIESLSPAIGPTTGGTEVTIIGTGFTDATGATFDGLAGTSFTVHSDTEITVTTPAHPVGRVDVVVTGYEGEATLIGGFQYTQGADIVPNIATISPDSGPTTGGTEVTITGTGFTTAIAVTFDGTAGTAFTVHSDTEITVTTPAGTEGAADVVVEAPAGASAPMVFTYVAIKTPDDSSTPDEGVFVPPSKGPKPEKVPHLVPTGGDLGGVAWLAAGLLGLGGLSLARFALRRRVTE